MDLHLRYKPVPSNAARFAADIVAATLSVDGVTLNYDPASLVSVDQIIERFRAERMKPEQIGETLFGFGCYVGEVFVRHAAGKWRLAAATPMRDFAGVPIVIELAVDRYYNPVGKVFKRLENGAEDDLAYFYSISTTR